MNTYGLHLPERIDENAMGSESRVSDGTSALKPSVDLPVEDANLWADFDRARIKMFQASQTGKSASRYGIGLPQKKWTRRAQLIVG
jgi:hypothetical protein